MSKTATNSPIAIVGMSALFAKAHSPTQFWNNIISGEDFISNVPSSHWLASDYAHSDDNQSDSVDSTRGSFLDEITFDPLLFGIPPTALACTDTAQLLALVAARKVLHDAHSMSFKKVDPKKTSVILGVAAGSELMVSMSARIQRPVWVKVLRSYGLTEDQVQLICDKMSQEYTPWEEATFPGLLANVVAGRIANRLDLGGTNCTVDAACASSLASMSMAIQELQLGHSDLVISGGVDALNDIFMYMCFSKTHALSKTGDCRPFAADADGTLLGEGVGMVALRRLDDAERDGDKIYAVITGIGSSSDGQGKSVYAPSAEGQTRAIERAYAQAGCDIHHVELIEAHGTGTIAGDAAEFEGLVTAFSKNGQAGKKSCALGSIKSQIGHTKSAAGIASVIKIALALHHKVLPPTIKVSRPNPKFGIEQTPFYMNTKTRPWIHATHSLRMAGASSFGFGGSNFHVVLQEQPRNKQNVKRFQTYYRGVLFLFSAETETLFQEKLMAIQGRLQTCSFPYLAQSSRQIFQVDHAFKGGFYASKSDQAYVYIKQLMSITSDSRSSQSTHNGLSAESEIEVSTVAREQVARHNGQQHGQGPKVVLEDNWFYSQEIARNSQKLAYLFPGQGSQYLNMGAALAMEFDTARSIWDTAIDSEQQHALHAKVFPSPDFSQKATDNAVETLNQTQWAQPAIGAMSLSCLALLEKAGMKPDCVAGHSYGEIPALYAAKVIDSAEDVIRLSVQRGQLMAACGDKNPGAMTAVFLSRERMAAFLTEWELLLSIANHNGPSQVVLSGSLKAIEAVEVKLQEKQIVFKRLPVSTGFHSEIVQAAVQPFQAYLEQVPLKSPSIPVYSNTSAKPYPKQTHKIKSLLAKQMAEPVEFLTQVTHMFEEGVRIFLEVGPNQVLTRLCQDILPDAYALSLDRKNKDGLDAFWTTMGQLAILGVPVDFAALHNEFEPLVDEFDNTLDSKASVKINGANYAKPYPPQGGEAELPKPTIAASVNHSDFNVPREVASLKLATEPPKAIQRKETNTMSSQPKYPSDQWIQAFHSLQNNMMQAQKLFQETLLQSHSQFMAATEAAINGLVGVQQGSQIKIGLTTQEIQQTRSTPNTSDVFHQQSLTTPSVPVPKESFFEPAAKLTHLSFKPELPAVSQSPMVAAPTAQVTPTLSATSFKDMMLQVVSEKTGYPEEMLELDIDLEAGFGIDSIKRVEILSALQSAWPVLKEANTSELTQLKTLGEILAYAEQRQSSVSGIRHTEAPQEVHNSKKSEPLALS